MTLIVGSLKFAETGGWGFEGFKGDIKERVVTDAKNACFATLAHPSPVLEIT